MKRSTGMTLDELQQPRPCGKRPAKGLLIVTGGPGTGKTTTDQCRSSAIWRRKGWTFGWRHPPGRAAKRMAEATGWEAKTIHRLLEVNRARRTTRAAPRRPPLSGMSTIRWRRTRSSSTRCPWWTFMLMYSLLKALMPAGTRLIHGGRRGSAALCGAGKCAEGHHRSSECFSMCCS